MLSNIYFLCIISFILILSFFFIIGFIFELRKNEFNKYIDMKTFFIEFFKIVKNSSLRSFWKTILVLIIYILGMIYFLPFTLGNIMAKYTKNFLKFIFITSTKEKND